MQPYYVFCPYCGEEVGLDLVSRTDERILHTCEECERPFELEIRWAPSVAAWAIPEEVARMADEKEDQEDTPSSFKVRLEP